MSVLVSCEVGGDRVPARLASIPMSEPGSDPVSPASNASRHQLPTRLNCDVAGRYVAQRMSDRLHAPLIANEYSSELIDVSRSLHHQRLYSSLTRGWTAEQRRELIDRIHAPYRARIRQAVSKLLAHFTLVIHLSVRSFALRYKGKERRTDCGLLYDPAKKDDVDLCLDWIDEMYDELPMLKVRRNYPRRGTIDSITKAMRSEFSGGNYIGIEVLVNRAWAGREVAIRDAVIDGMCDCLRSVTSLTQSDAA